MQETRKLLQTEIESLFKVESISGLLQKHKRGKSGAGIATMGPVSQSPCWDVVLLLSLLLLSLPLASQDNGMTC